MNDFSQETLLDLLFCDVTDKEVNYLDSFLNKGIDPNIKVSSSGDEVSKPLLEQFCEPRFYRYVDCLINHNADFNILTEEGDSPLHMLSFDILHDGENPEALFVYQKVLNKLPDLIDHQNEQGITALMLAAKTASTGKMKLLIEHGADVNIYDNNGNNALHFCMMDFVGIDSLISAIGILIDARCDALKRNDFGTTPIEAYLRHHPPLLRTPFRKILDLEPFNH